MSGKHTFIRKLKRPLDCLNMLYQGERTWGDVASGLEARRHEMGLPKFILKGILFWILGVIGFVIYLIYRLLLGVWNHKWYLLVFLIFAAWVVSPFLIDYAFDSIGKLYGNIRGAEVEFNKSLWFPVLATYMASLPGAMCGALAIIQTKRNHELEDRFHRPALRLESSSLHINWLDKSADMSKSKDPYYASSPLIDEGHEGRITWRLRISCRDNTEAQGFKIRTITFRLDRRKFQFQLDEKARIPGVKRTCERNIMEGTLTYDLEYDLFPCDILNLGHSVGDFWMQLSSVATGSTTMNQIEADIGMDVYHEYTKHGHQPVKLTIIWKKTEKNPESKEEFILRTDAYKSGEGYFSYEKK